MPNNRHRYILETAAFNVGPKATLQQYNKIIACISRSGRKAKKLQHYRKRITAALVGDREKYIVS